MKNYKWILFVILLMSIMYLVVSLTIEEKKLAGEAFYPYAPLNEIEKEIA